MKRRIEIDNLPLTIFANDRDEMAETFTGLLLASRTATPIGKLRMALPQYSEGKAPFKLPDYATESLSVTRTPIEVFSHGGYTAHRYAGKGDAFAEPYGVDRSAFVLLYRPRRKYQALYPEDAIAVIPTDIGGTISYETAIARLMDYDKNIMRDVDTRAKEVAPHGRSADTDEERMQQYLWWLKPDKYDYAYVDTPDAEWPLQDPRDPSNRLPIAVLEPDYHEPIAESIRRGFSDREIDRMRNLIIDVESSIMLPVAGYYQRGEGVMNYDKIVIGDDYLRTGADSAGPLAGDTLYDATVIHELIHYLRSRDQNRRGSGSRYAPLLFGVDHDLEEALTEAETLARSRVAPWNRKSGYYRYNPWGKSGENAARVRDKQLLTGLHGEPDPAEKAHGIEVGSKHPDHMLLDIGQSVSHGLDPKVAAAGTRVDAEDVEKMWESRGEDAVEVVADVFPSMSIARAKINNSEVEAIDTYWRVAGEVGDEPQTVETHVFDPEGASAGVIPIEASPIAGDLREYRDGKLVDVPDPRPLDDRHIIKPRSVRRKSRSRRRHPYLSGKER